MASIRFTDVQARPSEFLDLTSLMLDEFQQLGRQREAVDWLMRAQLLARQAGDTRTLQVVLAYLARLQEGEPVQGR